MKFFSRSNCSLFLFIPATFIIFSLAFSVSGCGKKKEEVEVKEVARPVKLLTVEGKSSMKEIKYPGRVRANQRVDLAFQVAGPLIELPVTEGQNVKKGEIIARILPRDFETEIAKAKAKAWVFDATKFSTRKFDFDDDQVNTLAGRIAFALSSENDFLMLEITCFAKVGKAQEIYPSEELVLDKGKGKKSKVLYSVDNIAAMHSQKIGNALRTIDTWYSEFSDPETSAGPIAIEPYGAVTNLGKAYRHPTKDKKDFYTFFDQFARGGKLERIEDEHYVMAVLVRGGVFGESDK